MTKEEYMKKAHSIARHALSEKTEAYDYRYIKNIAQSMALHCLWLLEDGRNGDGLFMTEQWLDEHWLELCRTDRPIAPG